MREEKKKKKKKPFDGYLFDNNWQVGEGQRFLFPFFGRRGREGKEGGGEGEEREK